MAMDKQMSRLNGSTLAWALLCLLAAIPIGHAAAASSRPVLPPTCLASAGQACGGAAAAAAGDADGVDRAVECGWGLACVAGRCVALGSVDVGGICGDSGDGGDGGTGILQPQPPLVCRVGLFCNQTTGRCQPLLAVNSAGCVASDQCAPGSFCSGSGVCVGYFSGGRGAVAATDGAGRGSCYAGLGLRGGRCVGDPKDASECVAGAPGNHWCLPTATCGGCCGAEEVALAAVMGSLNDDSGGGDDDGGGAGALAASSPLDRAVAAYRFEACRARCTGGVLPAFSRDNGRTVLLPPPPALSPVAMNTTASPEAAAAAAAAAATAAAAAVAGCFVRAGMPCNGGEGEDAAHLGTMAFGVLCVNGVGVEIGSAQLHHPCAPSSSASASSSPAAACGEGLYCDLGFGRCLARKLPGEACSSRQVDECAVGSACDYLSSLCTEYHTVGPNGTASYGFLCRPGLGYDQTEKRCTAGGDNAAAAAPAPAPTARTLTAEECEGGGNTLCNDGATCLPCCHPEFIKVYRSRADRSPVYDRAVAVWEYDSCKARCTGGSVPAFGPHSSAATPLKL